MTRPFASIRVIARLVASTLVALGAAARAGAQAPCPSNPQDACSQASASSIGNWLGDLNGDRLVNSEDIRFWNDCIFNRLSSINGYCAAADFNFDGVVDQTDLRYLNRLVEVSNGPGGRIPAVKFSEIRTGKPPSQTAPSVPESRYVEFVVPIGAFNALPNVPSVNQPVPPEFANKARAFSSGWYYLQVTTAVNPSPNGTTPASRPGVIAVVVPLQGMKWCINATFTNSRGLALLADPTFADPLQGIIPASGGQAVANLVFRTPQQLDVPAAIGNLIFLQDQNVTHLLVFRDPTPSNPRAVPQVGQSVNFADPPPGNPNAPGTCEFPFIRPSSPGLPPWDVIVDALTIDGGAGCTFAERRGPPSASVANIGPVGCAGVPEPPVHVYRCTSALTFVVGPSAVSCYQPNEFGTGCVATAGNCSDTPFLINPRCPSQASPQRLGCGDFGTGCTVRDCFTAHPTPGCTDGDCCNSVCAVDPGCCCESWEPECVNLALQLCRQCGTNQASCLAVHPTPGCSDGQCCDSVCSVLPQCCALDWDQLCVNEATRRCLSCGSPAAGACGEVRSTPYCSDANCCATVCNLRPDCCTVAWDLACVRIAAQECSTCGALGSGDCCIQHPGPFCEDPACCAAVCSVDPFCCATSWDYSCTLVVALRPECQDLGCECGAELPGGVPLSCFLAHREPGCTDSFCCQLICQRDAYCCYAEWDDSCVRGAEDTCSNDPRCIRPDGTSLAGSCYIARPSPGCSLPGCCSQVCQQRTECCDVAWDQLCVQLAVQLCDRCGDPYAGSCFEPHGTPHCSDLACCTAVCATDPFCCDKAWDFACAERAASTCQNPITGCGTSGRSCWVASVWTAGCDDAGCCADVCALDAFCCTTSWDDVCVRQANLLCVPDFPSQAGREGCLSVHASPGCAEPECSNTVCGTDPTCCTEDWDQRCVVLASALCAAPFSCPADGRCDAPHGNPGCSDRFCCSAVCNADPSCCDAEWDSGCASIARVICRTPPGLGWNCPCIGSCFESHDNPGCADDSCCNVVCHVKPDCCLVEWDAECAVIASFACCGPPGCASGCNDSCTTVHPRPFCSDPSCCRTVCSRDPSCCANSWDSLCVSIANDRCASACGMDDAGNCFAPHDLPSCRDGRCCARVCETDSYCCRVEWDQACVNLAAQASECVLPSCGSPLTGPPCVAHDSPASSNQACCSQVCAQDMYCCDTEWDQSCVDRARQLTDCDCAYECGDACAGSCCRAHDNAGCDDQSCCNAVCARDAFCCDELWDSVCAELARELCAGPDDACPRPGCGSKLLPSCCVPSPLPNCSDEACCEAVCREDPFCCAVNWDTACVERAAGNAACDCSAEGCGSPQAGDCFAEHATPACDDIGCCQTVCTFDPLCCEKAWDEECVQLAVFFCTTNFKPLLDHFRGGPEQDAPSRLRVEPRAPASVRPHAPPRKRLQVPGLELPERSPADRPRARER